MAEARVERRLAAILAVDVAGYSRLMGVDEEGTLAALKSHRRELIEPKIAQHHGRVIKNTGDGALIEFGSAVDAVRCALEIQRAMAERNVTFPEDRRIEFRIGINVGDVIFDDDDMYGDGVNIAARVEALARPGALCLSDNTYQQVKGKIALDVSDMGEQQLKNISQKVRVYGVRLDDAPNQPKLALPDKPSIAVLAFTNMSGDPEQEYFGDGIAEDVITALSRCNSLFVIARNSSFTYKGKPVDIRQVGRELGVRYVLEGSVRRSGGRLRVSGQLIEAETGNHIWADRFDGDVSDVFDFQDRITESVAAAIEPRLQLAEIERLKTKPARDLNAYDLLLRAQQSEHELTDESLLHAIEFCRQALTIDPNYAQAMALAAYCYAERSQQDWLKDRERETAEGIRLATRAVELAKNDANVLWMAAYAARQLAKDAQLAKELAYRSLQLNPNSAIALAMTGWIEAILAEPAKALEHLHRADRLSPRDPRTWFINTGIGMAHFIAGQYEEAVLWNKKALAENPRSAVALRLLASSLACLGQKDRAREAIRELLKIEPKLTISNLQPRMRMQHESVWTKFSEALRLAGLPE